MYKVNKNLRIYSILVDIRKKKGEGRTKTMQWISQQLAL